MLYSTTFLAFVGTIMASIGYVNSQSDPVGLVSFCPRANFTGNCLAVTNLDGSCVAMRPRLQDEVSSVQVQPGTTCNLFRDVGCNEPASLHVTGNVADLGMYGFNDVISSFKCTA